MIVTEAYIVIAYALIIQVFGCSSSQPELRNDEETAVYEFEFGTNDELNVGVKLKRIPSGCKEFALYYSPECMNSGKNQTCIDSYKSTTPRKGTIGDDKIHFTLRLVEGLKTIQYFIELSDTNRVFCTRKQILDGKWKSERPVSSTNCLKPGRQCEITVDFENKCDEKEYRKKDFCSFESPKLYVCEYENQPNALHQWHQINYYSNAEVDIGMLQSTSATKSKFIVNLLRFDNNTNIYNEIKTDHNEFNTTKETIIFRTDDLFNRYNITKYISYNEMQDVVFDCSKHSNNVIAALIDKSGYRIVKYPENKIKMKFKKAHSDSMLCCIYHIIETKSSVVKVHRHVESIMLLKYEYKAQEMDNKTNFQVPEPLGNEIDLPMISYYVSGAVGTIILLVIIIIIIKKINCCSKPNQEEPMALQSYENPNIVLYADLDIRPTENRQVIMNTTEESPYAEIIGVLKPK